MQAQQDGIKYPPTLSLNDKYYESETYLTGIPSNNANWIYSELDVELVKDATETSTLSIEDTTLTASHPHYADIEASFELFNEWQSWQTLSADDSSSDASWKAWRLSTQFRRDEHVLQIYADNNANKVMHCTKSMMELPFSSAVMAGILCNSEHYTAMDESVLSCKTLSAYDDNSCLVYAALNKPFPFSRDRTLLMVRFCYIFNNGRFLFGEKSISNPSATNMHIAMATNTIDIDRDVANNQMRAEMTNLWYVEPIGELRTHSLVTHYCHYEPKGKLSKFLMPSVKMDKAKFLLKLYDYLCGIKKLLHLEGQLFIPPNLFRLMDVPGSEQRNGEMVAKVAAAQAGADATADNNIIDINLAVQSVFTNAAAFIQSMKGVQQ